MTAITKISALPAAATLTGAELSPAVQSGVDVKTTLGAIAALAVGASVGLFTALGSVTIPATVTVVFTSGYSTPGVGAGRLVATATAGATLFRKQSADGRWWQLTEYMNYPDQTGALGDSTNDDLPAVTGLKALTRNLHFAGGRNYKLGGTLDMTDGYGSNGRGVGDNGWYTNPLGYGGAASSITGAFNNAPILKLSGPVLWENLYIQYATPQVRANTGAIAVQLETIQSGSAIKQIVVYGAQTSMGIEQAGSNNTIFGTKFENLKSYGATGTHYDFRNYLGGGTHTVIDVMYVNGLGAVDWSTAPIPCQYGLRLSGCELKINAIAMDGNQFDANAIYHQDGSLDLDVLHIESSKITTNNGAFIETAGNEISIRIGRIGIYNCRVLSADGVINASILKLNGNYVYCRIGEIIVDSACTITATAFTALNMASAIAGDVEIGPIRNFSGHAAVKQWITATENDIVRVFDEKELFKRVKAGAAAVESVVHNLYEAQAPGGGSYSTTKNWAAFATIVIIAPTAPGWPSIWYTPGGGVNPSDWVPLAYEGGPVGTASVGDADYVWAPYTGTNIIDCYAGTVARKITLGGGAAPRTLKNGTPPVRVVNRSGFVRNVYHTDGTTLLRAMANNTWCDFLYVGSFWQQYGAGNL